LSVDYIQQLWWFRLSNKQVEREVSVVNNNSNI